MKINIKIMLTFALAAMIFSACQKSETPSAPLEREKVATQNEIKQVSVEQAQTAVKAENAQFIDVRTPEEYAAGHAVQARNLPLDVLESNLGKLDKNKPIYVICQTGRRSQKGSEMLKNAGFTAVYNINGGTSEWINSGFPTEK